MRARLRWLADPMVLLVLVGGVVLAARTSTLSFEEETPGASDPGHVARCEVCRFGNRLPDRPDVGIDDDPAPLGTPVALAD